MFDKPIQFDLFDSEKTRKIQIDWINILSDPKKRQQLIDSLEKSAIEANESVRKLEQSQRITHEDLRQEITF